MSDERENLQSLVESQKISRQKAAERYINQETRDADIAAESDMSIWVSAIEGAIQSGKESIHVSSPYKIGIFPTFQGSKFVPRFNFRKFFSRSGEFRQAYAKALNKNLGPSFSVSCSESSVSSYDYQRDFIRNAEKRIMILWGRKI